MRTKKWIEERKARIMQAAAFFLGKERVALAEVARKAGVSWPVLSAYMAKFPEIKKAANTVRKSFTEETELRKARIMQAAAFFQGKRRVSHGRIARKAGVYASLLTEYMARFPAIQEAVNAVKKIPPKERVISAIKFFADSGSRASTSKVARRAKVPVETLRYHARHSNLIRKGLQEIKPLMVKDKIIAEINESIRKGKNLLCCKAIRARKKFGVSTYVKYKSEDAEIKRLLEFIPSPLPVKQRILNATAYLLEHLDMIKTTITRRKIWTLARVSRESLAHYERQPDGVVKRAVEELMPLPHDVRISNALHYLLLKSQFPYNKNLEKQSGLGKGVVARRMNANPKLARKIESARKQWPYRIGMNAA